MSNIYWSEQSFLRPLFISDEADLLYGNSGNDRLDGEAGNDVLEGIPWSLIFRSEIENRIEH